MPRETSWEDKNVLNTGCTGLLGSYLKDALIAKKANIIGTCARFGSKIEIALDTGLKETIDGYTHFFEHYQQSENL